MGYHNRSATTHHSKGARDKSPTIFFIPYGLFIIAFHRHAFWLSTFWQVCSARKFFVRVASFGSSTFGKYVCLGSLNIFLYCAGISCPFNQWESQRIRHPTGLSQSSLDQPVAARVLGTELEPDNSSLSAAGSLSSGSKIFQSTGRDIANFCGFWNSAWIQLDRHILQSTCHQWIGWLYLGCSVLQALPVQTHRLFHMVWNDRTAAGSSSTVVLIYQVLANAGFVHCHDRCFRTACSALVLGRLGSGWQLFWYCHWNVPYSEIVVAWKTRSSTCKD